MAKGSGLWDDSALVDAFNNAVATYKVMHGQCSLASTLDERKDEIDKNEPASAETRGLELTDDHNEEPKDASESEVPILDVKSTGQDVQVEEDNLNQTLCTQPELSGIPASPGINDNHPGQPSVDYNQLLKQYYELEEQKQKIVELLQQVNYWNYQNPSQSGEYQSQQVPAYGISGNCIYPSCSLCSPYCLTSSTPVTGCAIGGMPSGGNYCCSISSSVSHGQPDEGCQYLFSGGNSVGISCTSFPETQSTRADHEVIKVGMMAAERALNVIKEGPSASNIVEEKKEKDVDVLGVHENKVSEGTCQDPDLAVVLSAWYSAGFHTGRYLSEQARKKA